MPMSLLSPNESRDFFDKLKNPLPYGKGFFYMR